MGTEDALALAGRFAGRAGGLCAGALLFAGTHCTAAPLLEPGPFVESAGIAAKPAGLSRFPVSVHAILQIHENPVAEKRAFQDLGRVGACQDSVISTVLSLAGKGVTAVVVEGLYAAGTLEKPIPLSVADVPQTSPTNAKWVLANRKDLFVYGFESKSLNDFAVGTANQLGKSSGKAMDLVKQTQGRTSPESTMEINRLVQEEVTRLNLWWSGIVPARSYIALQTALAVALARGVSQIQLVIGKEHWQDLVYAANRHGDVRLRLTPYECR